MRLWRALVASFSYFSILPAAASDKPVDDDAIALLPIVGFVVGAAAGAGSYGIYLLTHAQLAAALTAWFLSIALSGAIHVDGFLDCCDGLFAMVSPERRVEIMRDPHHGTYAIVGMAMLAAVWLYALWQIPPTALPWALALCAFAARSAGTGVAYGIPNHRTHDRMHPSRAVQTFVGIASAVWFYLLLQNMPWGVFWVFPVAMAFAMLVGWFAAGRLGGGVTGDCYGAAIVIAEVAALLSMPYLVPLR